MLIQEKINIEIEVKSKKPKPKNPSFKKEDKIKEFIKEWNTIEDIELYKDLYKLCSQLFLATQNRKLECLNYYIDYERDSETSEEEAVMYAEIKNTSNLPMKERYQKHLNLLKRVMSNDTTLIYCENSISNPDNEAEENYGQQSLFI